MTTQEHIDLTKALEEHEEVSFNYNEHFICIQTHSEGGFDGSIYNSEDNYSNDEDCSDGGICEAILECVAIGFFMELVDNLKKVEICK